MEEDTKNYIDEHIRIVKTVGVKKYGDTPTDALQLTPKGYVDRRITGGVVLSDGTAGVPFPVGWSVASITTGRVTVTRTVDPNTLAKYAVVATSLSSAAIIATVNNKSSSSFDINTFDAAGAAADATTFFIVSAVY